ncbi:GNAT family N-acetyltransferase [Fusibacter ferrireducens]|uniref:GNAT family N-acetyltransferase n=1 Tax=Fusibacter ferrireducens TaxID=2785058 RepID=A0ABR9ZQD6_9FIRM|nr:GNAT family N-acetyltransferase [Fusibacter ferrireducens]MBF4692634.1 GNAT family N-acetyltransferase [Fusibacter ferrireducens]
MKKKDRDKRIDRNIEEISLNAFPAAFVDLYDGWVIRRTPNYPSRRINSVNVLTTSSGEGIHHKIDYCEAFFKERYSEIAFKMTNRETHNAMDILLASRGYLKVTPTNVMILNLDTDFEPNLNFQSKDIDMGTLTMSIEETLEPKWLEDYIAFKCLSEKECNALQACLGKISNPVLYLSVRDRDKWIGAGQAVVEAGYVGLFDIAVHEQYRCKGIGKAIMRTLLEKAKEMGAEIAYLQVVADNEAAKRLYGNLGFQELYQYWYRVKSF